MEDTQLPLLDQARSREVVAGQQQQQIVGSKDVIQIQGNSTIIIKGKFKVIHEGSTVVDLSRTEDNSGEGTGQAEDNSGEGTDQAVTTGRWDRDGDRTLGIEDLRPPYRSGLVLLCLLTPLEVGFLFGHSMKSLVVLLDWTTWVHQKSWWLKLVSILRVFRARKVYDDIQRLKDREKAHYYDDIQRLKDREKAHYYRSILVGFLEILFVLIFFIHLEGCLLYHIAAIWPNSKNTWIGAPVSDLSPINEVMKYYIPSVYFAMVTFTTVGNDLAFKFIIFTICYGDYHAVNELEKGFVIIALIFNFSLVVYLNGRLGLLLAKMQSKGKEVSSDVHFQES
ncbi:hypothetical protein FEM48_Zijuj07G0010500 [Ziziphus jujuba var. spinosa]|uniref:Uncharacterized protein n=1 Tax=Ziziphus jujuba var. spinosa TaxID=714518 RepID=A0A978V1J1_ZIZJJ|nr:hypothetical protein FEM48_Zijuj07G0010500 [Ziziphus jujuba var. spinosa]